MAAEEDDEPEWPIPPEENPWRQREVDTFKALVYHELYMRGDPFSRNLDFSQRIASDESSQQADDDNGNEAGALRGSEAVPFPRPPPVDPEKFREIEAERKRQLLQDLDGYQVWMRGHNPKSRLVLPSEAKVIAARRELVAQVRAGPQRRPVQLGSRPYETWYLIERKGRVTASHFQEELHDLGGVMCDSDASDIRAASVTLNELLAQGEAETQCVCWRADFVQEVKHAARGAGLRQATVTEYFPVTDKLLVLQGYVSAACSEGGREVWSPSFVNLLEALRVRWACHLDGSPEEKVRCYEGELLQRQPELCFPARRTVPRLGPVLAEMPGQVLQRLRQEGGDGDSAEGPPQPPALPKRLPHRVCYEQDEPWTRLLCKGPALNFAAEVKKGRVAPLGTVAPEKKEEKPKGMGVSSSLTGLGRRLSSSGVRK